MTHLIPKGARELLRFFGMMILFCLLFLQFRPVHAQEQEIEKQDISSSILVALAPRQEQKQDLKKVLKEMEGRYAVRFYFDPTLLEGKASVIREDNENLEAQLKTLLSPHHLNFKKLDESSYVIRQHEADPVIPKLKTREPGKPEVLKQMERHGMSGLMRLQLLEQTISGKVTDGENGEPLPGVNVLAKGTTSGTVTDISGNYRLTVADVVTTLVFSSIGYVTEEMEINSRNSINLALMPDIQSLSEVVVVGYGTVKKSDLTGSVSSLKSEDFNQGAVSSVDQLIQGRAAGVNVVQNSAEPGGGISISIRGASSVNAGTGPLYVIDGLPIDNAAPIGETGAEYVLTRSPRNPLSSINPADIESIEVLKDASATAIYGARGANGVILITTKKGSSGDLQVTYDGYVGVQNVASQIDLLSAQEYQTVLNELIEDGAGSPEDRVDEIANGGTDWQEELFQDNAIVQSHNLSFNGGGQATQYFISLNYFDQQGVVSSSSFKRYGARINLDHEVSDKFTLGLNLSTNFSIDDYVPVGFGINGESGAIYAALNFDPTLPVKNENGGYTTSPFIDIDNPLALAYGTDAMGRTFRTYGTLYAQYNILPELSVKLNVGGDAMNSRRDTYVGRETRKGAPAGGIASVLQGQKSNYLAEGTINYNKSFHIHQVNVLAGITTQKFTTNNTNSSARGFPADATGTYNLGLGDQSTFQMGSSKETNKLLSYIGRVNYSLLDRYLLTATLRIDGSSRFGTNNKYGYFPSFAVGWKVLEEPFISSSGALSALKLRASWGQTGNQEIGNYVSIPTFGAGPQAAFNDQPISTTDPSRLANPDLKWETTEQLDFGLDFGFLEDRIYGSMDYYIKNTFDMLLALPVPSSTGFTSRLTNIGSIKNSGFEFTLNSVNLTGAFKWTTSLNLATVKNTVTDLGGIPRIITGNAGFADQIAIIEEGSPLYAFYGYQIEGIWQENDDFDQTMDNVQAGDIRYHDVNQDQTVNADDRVILGNSFPDLTYSLANTFTYKNFEMNIFFDGVEGVSMLNNNLVDAYFPIQFRRNRFAEPYLNRWTPERPSNTYPSFINPTSQGQKVVNSYTVSDASYFRLNTLTMSYTLPAKLSFIKAATIYFTGQNLFTITKYNGMDPAVNTNGNANFRIDYNAYPTARTFLVGARLSL
ncbi:SusC/RagA family TonB-linked outer membrane protein [Catalinimonas niigatensis]|uniref:SusC/RagA family TonB-linked outer membrane protein n=1 Tax=Catalinimonas niigatensis TaxID=1397264 RepID=UPI00266561E6|nr:TonB-dependent receptor [Catalinimonas niigatensis]WPP50768.1 TonB-dependent receptor [Catalinimonas niigatensis]